jgi:Glycosyl transferase family 11
VTVRMKVCGGLGNQLFQYAAGLALARRHQARLIIDASFYRTKSHRSFQLNQFELDYELQGELAGGSTRFHAEPRPHTDICFSERSFCFDERFLTITPPVVLQGYYQSERYFADIRDELRAQIRLRGQPCTRSYEALNVIESSRTPVAVHVRRGDLITDDGVHPVHGCLGWPYYCIAHDEPFDR